MRKRNCAICYNCSRKVEYTECSGSGGVDEDTRCSVLSGWFSVSQWHGKEFVTHYEFCSLGCLRSWVESELPPIPDVFIKGFEED